MAKEAGVDVIVVDHHKCAAALPVAHALVNPNPLDAAEGAAHGHLAAVGFAFLLGAALVRTRGTRDCFADRTQPRHLALLDTVPSGPVADVTPPKRLNHPSARPGLERERDRRS